MKTVETMMQTCQNINLTEGGISFAEEGFTQLYDQSLKDLRTVSSGSAIAGAMIGVGLSMMSVGIVCLIKKRKLKRKEKEIQVLLGDFVELLKTSVEVDKNKLNK